MNITIACSREVAREHEMKLIRRDVLVVGWGGNAPRQFGRATLIDSTVPGVHRIRGVAIIIDEDPSRLVGRLQRTPDPAAVVILSKGAAVPELKRVVKARKGAILIEMRSLQLVAVSTSDSGAVLRKDLLWVPGKAAARTAESPPRPPTPKPKAKSSTPKPKAPAAKPEPEEG